MNDFIRRILIEARFWDDYTQELIDALVYGDKDKEEHYEIHGYPDDWLTAPADKHSTDEKTIAKLKKALMELANYKDKHVMVRVDGEDYALLKEAVKCPLIRKQSVIIDVGYTKVKVTTECFYKAIRNEIMKRAMYPNAKRDGLYVKIKKQLLHDNAFSNEDSNEID